MGAKNLRRLPAILSHCDTRDLGDFFDKWRIGIKRGATTPPTRLDQRISSVGMRGVSSNCFAS